ncbi:hypothetical protein ABPG75_012197 [Micractinium tetrahymenae]
MATGSPPPGLRQWAGLPQAAEDLQQKEQVEALQQQQQQQQQQQEEEEQQQQQQQEEEQQQQQEEEEEEEEQQQPSALQGQQQEPGALQEDVSQSAKSPRLSERQQKQQQSPMAAQLQEEAGQVQLAATHQHARSGGSEPHHAALRFPATDLAGASKADCSRLAALFEALAGRPFKAPVDELECLRQGAGKTYTMRVRYEPSAKCFYLQGAAGFGAFLEDSRAQPGDLLAMRRSGQRVPALADRLNFPEAGYAKDRKLVGQLSEGGRAPKRQRQQIGCAAAGAGPAAGAAAANAPAASSAAAADAACDRVMALRRFAARCASLFPGMLLPPDLAATDWELLVAVLTAELGSQALGSLEDSRDEWKLLADMLAAASGAAVSRQQAQAFFPPPAPGSPAAPDFLGLWVAGLYTAAWPLPLKPQAVRRAQREQQARQRPPGGFGPAYVGVRVSHHWRHDDSWYRGEITAVDARGCFDISYEDGDRLQAVNLPRNRCCSWMVPCLLQQQRWPTRRQRQREWQRQQQQQQKQQQPRMQRMRDTSAAAAATAVQVKVEPGSEPTGSLPAVAGAGAAPAAAAAGPSPTRRAPAVTPTWRRAAPSAAAAEACDARQQPQQRQQQQERQHLLTPSPAAEHPASTTVGGQPSTQVAGSDSVATALAVQRAQLAERKKQQARAELAGADAGDARAAAHAALRCLALAKLGGPRLKAALAGWQALSPGQQQEAYEALVLCSSEAEDWGGLEDALALVLP